GCGGTGGGVGEFVVGERERGALVEVPALGGAGRRAPVRAGRGVVGVAGKRRQKRVVGGGGGDRGRRVGRGRRRVVLGRARVDGRHGAHTRVSGERGDRADPDVRGPVIDHAQVGRGGHV